MHASKKGNQWHLGMKAHIEVDAESGLVHSVRGTSGHECVPKRGKSLEQRKEPVEVSEKHRDFRPLGVESQHLRNHGQLPH